MPFRLLQTCACQLTSSLMLTSSVSVSMTTIWEPHSYTMRQKSGTVSKSGPCAAAAQLRPNNVRSEFPHLLFYEERAATALDVLYLRTAHVQGAWLRCLGCP